MEDILRAKKVSFSYPKEEGDAPLVLNDITMNIKKGEFVAILGHNGSGKSTIAKHFNAILLPSGGDVFVYDMNTKDEQNLYNIRQKAGMVFQNPDNQIVATIVEEDVAFALENLGVEPSEIRKRVDEALKSVNMYDYRERAPHQLSGGQKQRVAIAGIIAMRPECIIMDEPTAMLDPHGRRSVLRTIKTLNKEHGITVALITHYMDEAAQADRIIVMDNGRMLLEGTPKEVFTHVELLKEVGLDVPQTTELIYELNKCGYTLPMDCLTEDECVEAVCHLLEESKCR